MMNQSPSATLQRSKRIALTSLLLATICWLLLLFANKWFPEYSLYIQILLLSAEAGMIGGLADWYAITVLFRNPFGRLPLPAFLRNHTEILPRNQARIAYSMGKFVQENFLSPQIVQQTLQKTDLSLKAGQWLCTPDHQRAITQVIQQTFPKSVEFIGQQQLTEFIQDNTVQWLQQTPINHSASQLLKAVLDNDFHQEVFQHFLGQIDQWIQRHPDKVYKFADQILDELGLGTIAKGASLFGFDMQQKSVNTVVRQIQQILNHPQHPLRVRLEQYAQYLIQQLDDPLSPTSQQLNQIKNELITSPAVLNFITQAISMLAESIKHDLEKPNSAIASHLQAALQQVGYNLQNNVEVRCILNQKITQFSSQLSEQYSQKVILFVSKQIESWDSSEMIAKIENEVGGDLHMIRVNGVIVGAMIGFILGLVKVAIDLI